MSTIIHIPKSGDPSSFQQNFQSINLQVLCCRYWWLRKWRSSKMSFPYWRLYWNKNGGAYVYKKRKVALMPESIILIPPNTGFSTNLENHVASKGTDSYELEGSYVENKSQEKALIEEGTVLHLFVHFNLGSKLDSACKEIFEIKIDAEQYGYIEQITKKLMVDNAHFDITNVFTIHRLILSSVCKLDKDKLMPKQFDVRITNIIDYIDHHFNRIIENSELARLINMATNSFTRYFKEQMHCSPQEYLRNVRVNKACNLLDHSTLSIDAIAQETGFSDRYHFSKVFKSIKGIPPAEYKKRFILR